MVCVYGILWIPRFHPPQELTVSHHPIHHPELTVSHHPIHHQLFFFQIFESIHSIVQREREREREREILKISENFWRYIGDIYIINITGSIESQSECRERLRFTLRYFGYY